jgi:hypothetical protein
MILQLQLTHPSGRGVIPFASGRALMCVALFLCGLISVQRFTLGLAGPMICLVPLLLAFLAGLARAKGVAASCLLLALVFSVDNGGNAYAETPAIIRYLIYVGVFLTLVISSTSRVRVRALIAACLVIAGICAGTLLNVLDGVGVFDAVALRRDAIVLVVMSVFLLARSHLDLDLGLIFAGTLGYLLGEVGNILFFYSLGNDYLSYNSVKSIAVFPVLYALLREYGRMWQMILAACTLLVIVFYGTRMITLSLLLFVILVPVVKSIRKGTVGIYVALLLAGVLLVMMDVASILGIDALERIKALSFFLILIENFDPSDMLAMFSALDPVRFAEHQLFFSRSAPEVLLGSGLGSGISDSGGVLAFVSYEQTAFSSEEIRTSTYFNLHDFWIDYGLRFGLVPVLLVMLGLSVRQIWLGRPWQGVLFGVLLINTTFATSGLLLTAMLVRCFPRSYYST